MDREVGGYRLERRLGRGAMGEVWLGRHEASGGIAAVKILRPEARRHQLFARERRANARLSHPHIVALYDVGPDFLATAYVHGPNLQHRMRVPIEPALALRIARQIASALDHAHASGVVHRDVKPSNILLDEEENAYLADFGIARILDEESSADVGAGTPAYMAPEQARGELATPLSDQYALGRTLLALLAGDRLPKDPSEALQLLPTHLPAELRAILWRATAIAADNRFPSMRGFCAALDSIDLRNSTIAPAQLPPRRPQSGFEWTTRAQKTQTVADLQRADYLLSELVEIGDFRRETGYRDFGFAVWGRGAKLGPVTSPEAFARATEIVVLLHGYFGTRDSWEGVAQSICRDNGHTLVLVPDLWGFGESCFEGVPSEEQASPAGSLRAVRAWLKLLHLENVPTVLVGHSGGAVAVLTATSKELGENVHRVAITPVFSFADTAQRRALKMFAKLVEVLGRFPSLFERFARWMYNTRDFRLRYDEANRERLIRLTVAANPRVLAQLTRAGLSMRPPDAPDLERCLIIVTPDDPLVPEEIVQRALRELGFPANKVFRLASGGHFPHARSEEHPEWTNRNIDDMVGLIDAVLDTTRVETTGASTSSRTQLLTAAIRG
jgi:pimeloyl-ACP methyl ester carboxylesterase/predicted Ser/Thr protein kinase